MEATIKDIRALVVRVHARCTECGDCLVWTGSTNDDRQPKVQTRLVGGRVSRSARRFVMEAKLGRRLKPEEYVTAACGDSMCLAPAHLELTTRSEISRRSNARPDCRIKRSMTLAKVKQATVGKLSMEKARIIRSSDRSARELAEEMGVSRALIYKVLQNRAWRDYGNPLLGLGAPR